jgi:hypothetical protein
MHLPQTMVDEPATVQASEVPLDFTQFLSERLSLEPPATLAMLGTFLLTFEPTRKPPTLPQRTPGPPTDHYSDYLEVRHG